jgi:hypothetical protein
MARPRTAKRPMLDSVPETLAGGGQEGHGIVAVSKADMVRAALAEGMETPTDGLGFIKSKYGVDFPARCGRLTARSSGRRSRRTP